jgi:hypothetical protein
VECLRTQYNGLLVPTENIEALARALVAIHTHYDQLPEGGRRSQTFAQAYSAEIWAERMCAMFKTILKQG